MDLHLLVIVSFASTCATMKPAGGERTEHPTCTTHGAQHSLMPLWTVDVMTRRALHSSALHLLQVVMERKRQIIENAIELQYNHATTAATNRFWLSHAVKNEQDGREQ